MSRLHLLQMKGGSSMIGVGGAQLQSFFERRYLWMKSLGLVLPSIPLGSFARSMARVLVRN